MPDKIKCKPSQMRRVQKAFDVYRVEKDGSPDEIVRSEPDYEAGYWWLCDGCGVEFYDWDEAKQHLEQDAATMENR